jgi:Kazal-type serine protease inhibitor domain
MKCRLWCAIALAACGPLEVVLATEPEAGLGAPCSSTQPCPSDSFCELAYCGATGRCVHRPGACPPTFLPVCGCDQVTYFNSCYRRAERVSQASTGECNQGVACGGAAGACAPRQVCNRLRFDVCSSSEGVCWSAPPSCPDTQHYTPASCGGPPDCLDLCEALRSKVPLAPTNSCQ